MSFYNATFFVKDSEHKKLNAPSVIIDREPGKTSWPISLHIDTTGNQYGNKDITIYMSDLQYIAFKNSILVEDARLERERKANDSYIKATKAS